MKTQSDNNESSQPTLISSILAHEVPVEKIPWDNNVGKGHSSAPSLFSFSKEENSNLILWLGK